MKTTTTVRLAGICLLAGALLVTAAGSVSASQSSARAVAMGGAYIGLASGVEAGRFNPANLGLTDRRQTGLELVGVGAHITNNAFTLDDYNSYTGAFLTTDDKEYILSRIPAEGLKLDVHAEAGVLSAATGPFAFTMTGVGTADINLSKDIFELVLNGNTIADTIHVTGSYSDAISYVSAGLSYGYALYSQGTRQLSVGVTGKYLRGIYVERVTELEGLAATHMTGFTGEGRLVAQTAEGGSGYGLDLGAALKLSNDYTIGATLHNALGSITWNSNPKEYGYIFSFDTMNVDNMGDDFVTSEDYDKEIESFTTTLPRVLTAGIAKTSGTVRWAVDWEQGLERKPGSSTEPRLALGAEWSPIGVLPLRAGYAFGGDRNAGFSVGSGLHAALVHLDFAVVTGNGFSGYSAKGANLALSLGLHF
ncbi:MAG: DUF5723 family protein [candidate division Zixibacteria bacterium]|jgi:hypothetical protein|nr:DUF5723 family protein [candidate division Zixibacteria bacterium]